MFTSFLGRRRVVLSAFRDQIMFTTFSEGGMEGGAVCYPVNSQGSNHFYVILSETEVSSISF